jgi:hemolysin activation/secretion protein
MNQTSKVTTMPRISSRLSLLAPCLALLLAAQAGQALAQQSTQQQTQQAQPQATQNQAPPKLERVEPGSDVPATNIPSRERTRIKETRDGGQVTEVEVTSSGSHYYMKPNNPPGNAVPGSGSGNSIRAPQWKVGEFDLSGKRKAAAENGSNAPTTADAPPPPPLPANATAGPEKK